MEIRIEASHICVISDLHLGNPYFNAGKLLVSFLKYLSEKNISLCINGDGVDLLQISFPHLIATLPTITERIAMLYSAGIPLYYVVGNHDIYLEKFLVDWKGLSVVPFLDVMTNGKLIRIEHGHLHDTLFIYYPTCYALITRCSGVLLKIFPRFHHMWEMKNKLILLRLKSLLKGDFSIVYEKTKYIKAAEYVLNQGYDAVIYGHTHRSYITTMDNDKVFANSGSWINSPGSYIEIKDGNVSLKKWEKTEN